MLIPEFTAPGYGDRTLNTVQRCVNWYPEKTDKGWIQVSAPGMSQFAQVTSGHTFTVGGQCLYYSTSGRMYTVDSVGLKEISSGGTVTTIQSFTASQGWVTMADNGTQLLVGTGDTTSYVVTMATQTPTAIVDANFYANTVSVAFLDGYFIAQRPGTSQFYLSALNDATDWTPATYATAETTGDVTQRLFVHKGQLYVFGSQSVEVWYNTGNASFPFERVTGSPIRIGTYGFVVDDNPTGIFCVALSDSGGAGAVWKISNGGAVKISTPYIESLMRGYTPASFFGFTYHYEGHNFYEIVCAANSVAWVYDDDLGVWHERTTNNTSYHDIACAKNAFWSNGQFPFALEAGTRNVVQLSRTTNTDNGTAITRIKDFGPIGDGTTLLRHDRIEIILEVDHDSSASYTLSGTLSWSDDGGLTFSSGFTLSKAITSGTTGQTVRLYANRLGSSRKRIYRWTMAGPAAYIVLKTCDLALQGGRH